MDALKNIRQYAEQYKLQGVPFKVAYLFLFNRMPRR